MDDMKISFKVEITGCDKKGIRCPHLKGWFFPTCLLRLKGGVKTARENETRLTKTCPMVRAQFEALE